MSRICTILFNLPDGNAFSCGGNGVRRQWNCIILHWKCTAVVVETAYMAVEWECFVRFEISRQPTLNKGGDKMFRMMFKSKIHRAVVTESDLNYIGSITIDKELMEKANLLDSEKVLVLDIDNGARFETYVMTGERGAGQICLNGAAARLVHIGDKVIIISFGIYSPEELKDFKSVIVFVDENNKVTSISSQGEK
jgi:aspartate 1-decarboxylase